MYRGAKGYLIGLFAALSLGAYAQHATTGPKESAPGTEARLFHITFAPGNPVEGLRALSVLELPFECADDGTAFVGMFDPAPIVDPSNVDARFLAGIPRSGEVRSYRLSGIPDLNHITELSHYVSGAGVVFLIRATDKDQGKISASDEPPEYHDYIIPFERSGERRDAIRIEDGFRASQIGVFPSGNFLVYGFDEASHAPRLALFGNGGALLKDLRLQSGMMPESALMRGPGDKTAALYVSPRQLVPHHDAIMILQSKTKFPLLEVRESGAIRAIRPKLPEGVQVASLIPSDGNLFALVNDKKTALIYELDTQTGAILRRFQEASTERGVHVACVYEGSFLAFKYGSQNGNPLNQLIGTVGH